MKNKMQCKKIISNILQENKTTEKKKMNMLQMVATIDVGREYKDMLKTELNDMAVCKVTTHRITTTTQTPVSKGISRSQSF